MNKVKRCLLEMRKVMITEKVEYRLDHDRGSSDGEMDWFELTWNYSDYPDIDNLHRIARSYGLNSRHRSVNGIAHFSCDDFPF